MKENSDSNELVKRFLLDELDEHRRSEVEDRLLSDSEFYEQVLVAEADLTDDYVRGGLSAGERERFEKSFALPHRRKRVEFARGLVESATLLPKEEFVKPSSNLVSAEAPRDGGWLASLFGLRPALSYGLAAAALIIVAAAIWVAVERMRDRVPSEQARTEDVPQKSGQNDGAVASPRAEGTAPLPQASANPTSEVAPTPAHDAGARPAFATITLAPGALRGGAASGDLSFPRAVTHVRVRLQLDTDDYRSYHATVSTPEGRRVWAGAAAKDREKDARSVTFTLPAASLARGDYIVELSGVAGGRAQPAAQYSFRVIRKD